ncbi:MAG: type II toxin-antitoxin system VapC family toxin [Cyclobacteriaceae bacterium]
MILLDSNIVIYGVQAGYQYLRDYLAEESIAVSKITLIEVLGYHQMENDEKTKLEEILAACHQFALDDFVIQHSIALRQKKKMSLGDAIIAATAIQHQLPLVTANEVDFRWIPNLQIHNPIR